jgi:hypothetical protein
MGAKGFVGQPGVTGPDGAQGTQGPQGAQGATGFIIGPAGEVGMVGQKGPQGPAGQCLSDIDGNQWTPETIIGTGIDVLSAQGMYFRIYESVVCTLQITGNLTGNAVSVEFSLPQATRALPFYFTDELLGTMSIFSQSKNDQCTCTGIVEANPGTANGLSSFYESGQNGNRITLSLNFIFATT